MTHTHQTKDEAIKEAAEFNKDPYCTSHGPSMKLVFKVLKDTLGSGFHTQAFYIFADGSSVKSA